ncbi:hypothetical protein FGU65_09485 [Methanoculleus sp. FWC-SCC1]|uniref:CARDB domain-containing protein n=1 Tax=Methanoculleus frigidifontis TaxID=2584085 RepID=A0ABT8MAZ8_9EURY|nr:hypothetical protein [Methanoculleus sp. FWC-SCC1]MDN7025117.1 hypothetical protein [Methanoculleus sp. FWC-SCC1]
MAIYAIVCAVLLLIAPALAAPADVTVTSVSLDPAVLMRGDEGILTVTVQNTGLEPVPISRARLYGDEVVVLSDPYPSVGDIGAGNTKQFTFTVRADAPDGTYYPRFVLEFRDDGSLRYPVPVRVESTPLQAAVVDRPDTFSEGREADVAVRVGNPRSTAVTGVRVVPEGSGFTAIPSSAFIGTLAPDQAAVALFNITPQEETNLTFRVIYQNGRNVHETTLALPLTLGEGKIRADPVLTGIEVIQEAGIWRVTGDVTNAGLETARSVIVTSAAPAMPTDPFRVYVVGTLDPDDFSSFEVTFETAGNVSEVPLVVEYRDDDGNLFTEQSMVALENRTAEEDEGDLPLLPIVVALVVVIAAAAAGYYLLRRRRG